MDSAAISVKHRLMHHFGQGRMRENGRHQFRFGRFQRFSDRIALNQLGDFSPDHVCAQEFAGLCVEYGLDHAFAVTKRDGLAVTQERKTPDLYVVTRFLCCGFRHADTGNLRAAIGAARNARRIQRVGFLSSDLLDADDTFMACLVRQPRRSGQITDGVYAGFTGFHPFVNDDVATIDFNLGIFETDVLHIAGNANRQDNPVDGDI